MNHEQVRPNTIVLPRTFPDLDGVACAIGYAELLRHRGANAAAWLPTQGDSEAEFVLARCHDVPLTGSPVIDDATRFVLVDASDLDGLPSEVDPRRIVEVLDHRLHGSPRELFPNADLTIEAVGAAATLVAEAFRSSHKIPSSAAITLLYGAIHSNTQRLRGSVTTERDRESAAWLEELGAKASDLDDQFAARRVHILSTLEASVARETKEYREGQDPYLISQLEFEGAMTVAVERERELSGLLAALGQRAMLNMVDVATGTSVLMVPDAHLRNIVTARMAVVPNGITFQFHPAVLRKQIVAAIEGR